MAPILLNEHGVKIYVRSDEHLPPHIHAKAGDDDAMVDICTGELIRGEIEIRKLKFVQQWLSEGENRKNVEEKFYQLNPDLRPGSRFDADKKKK